MTPPLIVEPPPNVLGVFSTTVPVLLMRATPGAPLTKPKIALLPEPTSTDEFIVSVEPPPPMR